jgi:large conductance mechanosensitive channel
MKIVKEFKEFAMRGNVLDMAVGIIIGGAFGKIVSSIVNDILMPPIGKVMGGVNFRDLYLSLDPEKTRGLTSLAQAREKGAAVIAYGEFLNILIDFIIVAFCVFLMVKGINTLKRKQPVPAPAPSVTKSCSFCISEIPLMATRCPHCTSEIK